jgi:6-phospho-beta-glucosidase
MKVVIVGGSALSTPSLWSYLSRHTEGMRVVLLGRDPGRLQAVCRACRLLGGNGSSTVEYRALNDPGAWNGMEDARVFVIQVRNGGYAARDVDETLPLDFGVCGDEGLGPGGLSAGIRNWRAVQPLVRRIAEIAPGAIILVVSSPVGLLVRAASRAFPEQRILGICELPWTTLLDIARALGIPPDSIRFDYAGVNHLGWFYRLEAFGQDILDEYARTRRGENDFPSAALIDACGAVPLPYLKLHYERESTFDGQRRSRRSRGAILAELSAQAFEVYATGAREDIERTLRQRPSPWYPYAIGPFLACMAGQTPHIPFFLSAPGCGVDEFEPEDVLECAYVADEDHLRRLPLSRPVPQQIKQTLTEFVRYERLAAQVLRTSDPAGIGRALEAHPWTRDLPGRNELARAIYARC